MSLFNELYAMATTCSLSLLVTADAPSGKLTINVIPKPKPGADEPALKQPLSLTATPDEFDREFLAALRGYRECHASLAAQAEATLEVLTAATKASAKKAGHAVVKAKQAPSHSPTHSPMSRSYSTPADPPTSNDEDAESGSSADDAGAGLDSEPDACETSGVGEPSQPQLFG